MAGSRLPETRVDTSLDTKPGLISAQISTRMSRSLALQVELNHFGVSISARSPTNVIYLGLHQKAKKHRGTDI